LLVFNKADRNPEEAARLAARFPGSVAVSAATGEGIDVLLEAIGDRLRASTEVVDLVIPFERGDVLAEVHRQGQVLGEAPREGGMPVRARLEPASAGRLAAYRAVGAGEQPG